MSVGLTIIRHSSTRAPSYKLAKFLVPKLYSVRFNEFIIKYYFVFAKEIVHQDSKILIGSLDVRSLFTNIPLEETINLCTYSLYKYEDVIEGISKSGFKNLLSLATQESYFIFNDVLYKIKDGVAMRLPLGLTMANVFFVISNGLKSALRNLNQFFTEDILMTLSFSLNRLTTFPNFVIILILVMQAGLFPLNNLI